MILLDAYQKLNNRQLFEFSREKYGVNSLLGRIDANPKLAKNAKNKALSVPLHLSPHTSSGYNVCAKATNGCISGCLHTAGNPAYMEQKFKSRLARTLLYFGNRALFIEILRREIKRHVNRANKINFIPAIRLNGTSDIQWENVRYSVNGKEFTLFTEFPNVQFYDYTKIANRKRLPENYHLTFSLAENNHADAFEAFVNGLNVAVVFDTKRNDALPETFKLEIEGRGSFKTLVIDGDLTDYRPHDAKQAIVGLRAKGKAIGDKSGFVCNAAKNVVIKIDQKIAA